jgi:hypothetical protein
MLLKDKALKGSLKLNDVTPVHLGFELTTKGKPTHF